MRTNHTKIPWGPVVPHVVYEGYVAFCERQRDRVRRINPDFERRHQERRVTVPTILPLADQQLIRDIDTFLGEHAC